MAVKVGINGFGRIGRNFLRAAKDNPEIDIVCINDLADTKTLAYLLKYDSVLGNLKEDVKAEDDMLVVGSKKIKVVAIRDPKELPWKEMGVQVALESTGHFTKAADAAMHLDAGAERVIISAPSDSPDLTVVLGVNDAMYDPAKHRVISNASCTTNGLAPVAKVLLDTFGFESGYMTTIHAYTNDQQLLDFPHKDLRRARAAALSLIPTSTGAARAIGLVVPELEGRMDGIAVRAPIPDGSLVDLTAILGRDATTDEVNAALKKAADGPMKGYLVYCEDPIVSADIVGNPASSIVDAPLTYAKGKLAKVFAWYDNEWGYSNRLVDLIIKVGS
jgi:glyceraldehyde 3-phosphate dehydrogenase